MKAWACHLARLLSELFEYPFEQPQKTLAKTIECKAQLALAEKSALSEAEHAALKNAYDALEQLCTWYEKSSSDSLQEEHVAIFDLTPHCSLHLTWHKYGDSPDQGRALAGLMELYKDYGLQLSATNLPDYLPIMLEFMAHAPAGAIAVILDGFDRELRQLASHISETDSGYAQTGHCLLALLNIFALENVSPCPAAQLLPSVAKEFPHV